MSSLEWPNCKQFRFKKQISVRGCGWRLLLGVPVLDLLSPRRI